MVFTLVSLATEFLGIKEYKQTKRDKPKQHQQNANTMRQPQSRNDHDLQNDLQKLILPT